MTDSYGTCLLCSEPKQLRNSHIVPSFIMSWLKDGGYLRHSMNVNLRAQDGPKAYLLCGDCETLLCTWEAKFAGRVFYPFSDEPSAKLLYEDWLLKFCVSLSWRSLHYMKGRGAFAELSDFQRSESENALSVWREFLTGIRSNPGKFEQHLLPLGAIDPNHSRSPLPPNINRYLMRAVEIDIGRNSDTLFVYSKIGRFALFGFVDVADRRSWIGTRVAVRRGTLQPREFVLPAQLFRYLVARAQGAWDAMKGISAAQDKKIYETFERHADRLIDSDTIKAFTMDYEMFGPAAFRPNQKR